jgi:signal transduction histidine kinase
VNDNDVVIELRRRVAELEAAEARHKRVEKELIRNLEERLMTEETLRQRNRELALIHHAGPAFSSTLDLDRVLVSVLEETGRLLDVVGCSVWLVDSETGELFCQQATGPQGKAVRGWRLAPGEGLAGWVASRGESLIVPDTRADERHFRDIDEYTGLRLRSILGVPLRVRQDVIGVLQVVDHKINRFSVTDLRLLEPLAASAAVAIENARLYGAVHQELTQRKRAEAERERLLIAEREQRLLAETLREVTLALTSQMSHEAVLDEILHQAQRIVSYRTAHIVLLKDETLRIARWQGYKAFGSEEFISKLVQPLADYPLDAEAMRTRKPLVIRDRYEEPRWTVDDQTAWVKSHLALPICLRDRVLGLLRLDSDVSGEFSAEDAQRLEPLASAAAIALENARLYGQVKRHAVELETRVAERTHELAEANERLQELDRLKSRFVSDVSHELRTPVANIKLYLHLLEYGKVEKRSDYLTVLKEQSDRQSQLVEDILRLSRLELGKEKVEFVPVDLNAVVGQVVTALQPAAEAANLELTFEPDEGLPPVRAERNQLAQVVTNLVTNAIKYTPAGQVRINVCSDAECGQACLEVHDTGMGIDPQDLPHIFERFYRGQKVGGSTVPGTGLGLSIVKEIVDLHEGKIEVESQLGTGSTFRVWLPLKQGNK